MEIARLTGNLSDAYRHSLRLGLLTEILVLSFYMANQVTKLRQTKEKVQSDLLKESEKNATELEIKVEERTTELSQANEAKSRFLSILGHDFRGPIASMAMTLQLIKQQNLSLKGYDCR